MRRRGVALSGGWYQGSDELVEDCRSRPVAARKGNDHHAEVRVLPVGFEQFWYHPAICGYLLPGTSATDRATALPGNDCWRTVTSSDRNA